MEQHSEACLTIPAIVTSGYTATRGSVAKMVDLEVYVTGSPAARRGIIAIYDVFGMSPQAMQGADILRDTLNALVLMPDFFKGKAVQQEWVPQDTEEKKKLMAKFREERADIAKNVTVLLKVMEEAKELYPDIRAWGSYGLCWGGKIVALTSGAATPFKASGQVHPGRLAKADASSITIPHIMLASKDESAEIVAHYKEVIDSNKVGGIVETYSTMHHGWMGARGDLEDSENLKEYQRGYVSIPNHLSTLEVGRRGTGITLALVKYICGSFGRSYTFRNQVRS
ncbi:hypothetical protein B7494_g1629 [Chlorociboria aeruginascens]|nr:hypothetical protein B7494_g1629 [Chlorociboria aeruginascens]